jgi:sec-independent protein translocase protein TatA
MFGISPVTVVILVFIGVLLFGKDLPEVARNLGKHLLDLRRSLQGLHDDVLSDRPVSRPAETVARPTRPPQRIAPTAKKFTEDEPPPST